MVIAGPGTGKTTILTLRIANILRLTDTPPECILALTFTESGAHAMRMKLAEIVGSAAYRVTIGTFHGFANSIIQNHPESFPRIIGSRSAGEIDQIKILENIFKSGKFKILRPQGDIFYYVRPALLAIRSIKKEGFNPAAFKSFTAREEKAFLKSAGLSAKSNPLQRKFARNRELHAVFKLYEKIMRGKKLYDYEDMLLEVVGALSRDKTLLSELRENTHYILADEHQDANGAQNRLLELLASFDEAPNLFIVGDEKQAIYRFQGASLENFLYFSRKFPAAVKITLTKSFRSTQTILDAAHSLIGKLPTAGDVGKGIVRPRLLAQGEKTRKLSPMIEVKSFETEREEAAAIAQIAERIIKDNPEYRVAILYRDNKDAEPLVKALRSRNINFTVFSDESVLSDPDIENLLFSLKAVNDLGDEEVLGKALFADFYSLPVGDVFKLINFASKRRRILSDLLTNGKILNEAKLSNSKPFLRLGEKLKNWAKEARNSALIDFLDDFLKSSGFTEFLLQKNNPLLKLEHLNAFYEIARAFAEHDQSARLSDFINHLEIASAHRVKIGGETKLTDKSAPIALMTAHRSKGLEFDAVFIARADDDHWSARAKRELFHIPQAGADVISVSEEDDERRLFYVAMTRAKARVIITHANFHDDGKPIIPSRFIEDLNPDLVKRGKFKSELITPHFPKSQVRVGEKGNKPPLAVLRSIFLEEGLTVTALNNFLKCPWKYFFQNLVRLPQQPERHQLYGTAVHEALKRFQEDARWEKSPTVKKLLGYFERAMEKQPLASRDYKDLKERGIKALKKFFSSRPERYRNGIAEMKISGVPAEFDGGTVNLRGVIDLFVPVSDSSVSVIDYKTGKPKSRNEIEGKTAASGGDMFRQLVFYKLLIEESRGEKARVDEGAIVFVEPDQKGICRKETFAVTDEQVAALRKVIKDASEKIYNLSFWNETCADPDCEFCKLAEHLRKYKLD